MTREEFSKTANVTFEVYKKCMKKIREEEATEEEIYRYKERCSKEKQENKKIKTPIFDIPKLEKEKDKLVDMLVEVGEAVGKRQRFF